MKKLLLVLSTLIFFFLSCSQSPEKTATKGSSTNDGLQTATIYECPMKCDGKTFDKPGKCPVCGMDLIAKK